MSKMIELIDKNIYISLKKQYMLSLFDKECKQMTKKELKRLRRSDLMEILLDLSKENEELREQLKQAEQKLQDRQILIEESGSLAEAALRLNRMFEYAQAACEQYKQNVRLRCEQLENETKRKCEEMMHQRDKTNTD